MATRLRFRRRDRDDAFERLLRPHLPGLMQFAFRLTQSESAAEDLVQDTCLRFLPKLETLESLDNPRQWLAKALYRVFVDQYRRQQRTPVEFWDDVPDCASPLPTPEADALRACTQAQLLAALDRLPPLARDLVIWHDVEGHTLDALGDTLDTPLGTLKARLHRARKKLREDLMQPFDDLLRE